MRRNPFLIAALLASLLLSGSIGLAQDSTYAPWQGASQGGDMQQLLKQLRALIEKAERARAADPVFLQDLRKLADSYGNPWPARVLYDDFKDGDFTNNPAWTVTAGKWRINTQDNISGLQSWVQIPQSSSSSQGGSNTQNTVTALLGALLQQQSGQSQQQTQDQYAGISTTVAIPNSFSIHLEIVSRQPGGRFDFGPYRGASNASGYYLTYMPAQANGLTLWSVTGGAGNRQVANSDGPVQLEDRALHAIDWKRDRDGKMTIALDGKIVMEATDLSLHKGFDGFVMGNSGGSYIVHSITIDGSR